MTVVHIGYMTIQGDAEVAAYVARMAALFDWRA